MKALALYWLLFTAVVVVVCGACLAWGLWLVADSVSWVKAADHVVSKSQDPSTNRLVPTVVTWRATDGSEYTAPFPDRENVRVEVGSRTVWFHPSTPHIMRAYSEDQPVSPAGLIMLGLAAPVLVGYTLALYRSR